MPAYLLSEENYEGDLSITVVETVGIERDAQHLSSCIDFQDALYSKSTSHAGGIIKWNHTFTFSLVPGQSYLHLALIDGESDAKNKKEIAKTHINQSSLLCEDKLVHEGTVDLCFPLIVDDEDKMQSKVRAKNQEHQQQNQKIQDTSSNNDYEDDEVRIDMSELQLVRGKESARAFPEMHTIVTPQKPKQHTSEEKSQFSLRVTPQNTAVATTPSVSHKNGQNLFMYQQQQLGNYKQAPTARLAHHVTNTTTYGNTHCSGLFSSPSLLYPASTDATHVAMKRASVLNLLNTTSENAALPKGETPLLYIDLPSFVKVSIQWKPRWIENRAKDIMSMVNKGRGWSKTDANEWQQVCNMPYPCDYLWNRIETGHNWYNYASNNKDNSHNNVNNVNNNNVNNNNNNSIEMMPIIKRRNSILLKQPILSPKSTEYASPLHVLSFLMTFSNFTIASMHKACSVKYNSNNYPPNNLPSKYELLRARQIIAGIIDANDTQVAEQPELSQNMLLSPQKQHKFNQSGKILQTPSRMSQTPSKNMTSSSASHVFHKSTAILPKIEEQEPSTPIKRTYAPQTHTQQPKKGILGLRK